MKILHILGSGHLHKDPDAAALSGVVRVTLEYAKRQAVLGHEVHVVGFGESHSAFTWSGIKMTSLEEFSWAQVQFGKRRFDFRRHLPLVLHTLTTKFDVIHSHMHPYFRWMRGNLKVAHMHTASQADANGKLLAHTKAGLIRLDREADLVIAVSLFVKTQLQSYVRDHKLRIIYNGGGFTTDQWNEALIKREATRNRLNVPKNGLLIMYAGAFVPEKGVHHLAQAFATLAGQHPQIFLALAGGGGLWGNSQIHDINARKYTENLQAILSPVRDRTRFLGLVPSNQMATVYASADILVVPSIWQEAFGITALEGLSGALPVIASRSGGLAELIGEKRGLLVPPGDDHALTQALEHLISNPVKRKMLGEQGQAYAREPQFTWDQAARQTLALYEEYLGGQK